MIPLISFLIIILVSIIFVRVGSVALELTGLSSDVASFQAQSAFSGVGFTTSESEIIVNHPLRRRIIKLLILTGSAGMTSSIATLILTFVSSTAQNAISRIIILLFGLIGIYFFSRSKYLERVMKRLFIRVLNKYTKLKLYDYEQMLGLGKGYSISRIVVKNDSWIANKKLKDLDLDEEGLLVLAIYRKENGEEKFIGTPKGDTLILSGDVLVCYSREDVSIDVAQREKGRKGDAEHKKRVLEERHLSHVREIRGGYDE